MTLVAYEKRVMPICALICSAARDRGIADLGVGDHDIQNMTRPVSRLGVVSLICSLL